MLRPLRKEHAVRPLAEPIAKPPPIEAFDSAKWSGDVDAQRTEAKRYVIGVAVLAILAAPFTVWIGTALATALGL